MQSRVILGGEPILFENVPERVREDGVFYNVDRAGSLERIPAAAEAKTRAAMMIPVKHETQVIGVVQVMTDEGMYTRDDLDLVQGLVAQMGSAVRTARLRREQQRLAAAEAAARAIAREREQAALVLEAVGDAVFLVDHTGVVRLWNAAAAAVTGIDAADVRGRRLEDVVEEWSALSPAIPAAAGGEPPRPVTVPIRSAGRDLWLSVVAVASAAGTVYACRDVTIERLLEEERSDFIATISHELRTPMAAVYGAAETLLRREIDPASERGRQLLEMISQQAARLAHVTEEVLLTRNLDRGEVHLDSRPVDVGELVHAAVEALEARLQDPIPISLRLDKDLQPTDGDPDRLQQVLLNLLDNAVKYGGRGIEVSAEATAEWIRVVVADDGPGVPASDRDRIFEKFVRGDPQLARAPGGTGLGLYISRELTKRMGGRLRLESPPEGGAVFVLELPPTAGPALPA